VRLRPEQLETHLANALARSDRSIAALYLIHGDEPLLALEAADAVRTAARKRGYAQREVYYAERGFDWSELRGALGSPSLFGEKKIVELRLASGRMPAPAAELIEKLCESPDPHTLFMVAMPKIEGTGWWKSGWFTGIERAGMVVEAQPVTRAALPDWIARRLAKQNQRAGADALAYLADRVEGNLLAAQQEILKLALLAPAGELAQSDVEGAVASVARYDYDTLVDALYAGDFPRFARALAGLRGEGESAAGLAWRLGEELAALARIRNRLDAGQSLDTLFGQHRIWRAAQPRCERALKRFDARRLQLSLLRVARIERATKGIGTGEPWDELLRLGLELSDGKVANPVAH
jgi:DNA polymerase-3 subunit delta